MPKQERLTVAAYFDVSMSLQGMPELVVPEDADKYWWDTIAVDHLSAHWPAITPRFDTIIIDEAQDFSPAWITQLSELLDPGGPRRLLMVADEAQRLYPRGFTLPTADDGWARCELVTNCRNSFPIADLLHRMLDGPAATPTSNAETAGIDFLEAGDLDSVTKLVGEEIDRIVDLEGHEPPRVLVATFFSEVREHLRESLALVAWEAGSSAAIICENVHRVKGLEFDYVILASPTNTMSDALLCVGISRAITGLTVIGPCDLGNRLGLASQPKVRPSLNGG